MEQVQEKSGGNDTALDLLKKQTTLIDAEIGHVAIQTISQKIGLVLKASALALVLLLFLIAAMMLWRASREPLAVVQPFSSPPAFEQAGIDGPMLASGLLDHLIEIAETTNSRRRVSSYSNGWSDNIRVELPNTGVSVSEMMSLARKWAGNETLITGELFRQGEQIVLSARISGRPARRYSGDPNQLDQLLRQAAEGIYRDSQPYRYAIYLGRTNRRPEMMSELRRIQQFGEPLDQHWARSAYAEFISGEGDVQTGKMLIEQVLRDAPWFSYARELRGLLAHIEGRDEQALQDFRTNLKLLDAPQWRSMVTDDGHMMHTELTRAHIALLLGDHRAAANAAEAAASINLYDMARTARVALAGILIRLHEPKRALRTAGTTETRGWIGSFELEGSALPADAFAEWGDWRSYRRELERADAELAKPETDFFRKHLVWPRLAVARARTGSPAEALQLAAALPSYCYRCTIARAKVAALLGRDAESQSWFRKAIASAPSLPQAPLELGLFLLEQGRTSAAIEQFRTAHDKGPGWADPLKFWGDALLRSRRPEDAASQYSKAVKLAPRWGGLRLNYALALARSGRAHDAAQQLAMARQLELTASESRRLSRLSPIVAASVT